ncbi:hypothetical protein BS78_08G015100 [Paspalum vaginatum]|nr:hypothetical protein BS78_08G015100 [Paspalum vaginatum]
MARRRLAAHGGSQRLAPVSPAAVALPLLLLAYYGCCLAAASGKPAAAATAAVDTGGMRMNVKYSPEEVARWIDRMSNSPDSPFRPATDEESAFFNRMASGNGGGREKKTTATKRGAAGGGRGGGGSSSGAGGVRPGFDGHIEFSDQYPFARIVVDGFHSGESSSSSQPDGEAAAESASASSHAEYYDVKDL